ncbi:MAG: HAD-IA family hydrolase [Pseudomonadota bacterium]
MSPNPIVVFDLDGTLADTVNDLLSALNRTLARQTLPHFTRTDFARLSGYGGMRGMIKHAFEAADIPLTPHKHTQLFAETVRDYDENIAVETQLYPGVGDCLDRLSNVGCGLAVCTNKPCKQANKLLQELNVAHKFAAITGGDSFDRQKPDPSHLMNTIDMAGGCHKRAIMVGDSEVDVLAGRNAGVPVIAVDFGYTHVPVETFAPEAVISHFDHLFEHACGMLRLL